ncbi:MAG: FHA domain-containing protein [Planctomycetota bacterium]|nr:FHA domain-containing protein [Planctomycetota bacterium]
MDRSVENTSERSEFAAACGQRGPLRFRIFDSRSGKMRETQVPGPAVLVGSSEECDLCLNDPEISRRHAYLQVVDGHLICCDLDSRTGIHWGKSSRPRGCLEVNESLHIGPFMLTLLDSQGNSGKSTPLPAKFSTWDAPGDATAPFVLSFLNAHSRSGKKRICRIVRRITLVGWSDVCNLRLQHNSVDRVHGCFLAVNGELWVVELQSETGIEVNDRKVVFRKLAIGDHIRLGKFQLSVSPLSEARFADDEESEPELPGGTSSAGKSTPEADVESETKKPKKVKRKVGGLVPSGGLRPVGAGEGLTPRGATGGVPPMDPATTAMMQHFQSMQQQFIDHTQQMMSMVVQAFSSAHNRQLDVIREELQRVHDLNRELQELQARRSDSVDASEPQERDTQKTDSPAAPSGAAPAGPVPGPAAPPAGEIPPGMFPPGMFAPGTLPPGMFPPGTVPPGMFPPGMFPPGTLPPGMFPGGAFPPGTTPPGFPMGPGAPFAAGPAPRKPLPKAAKRPADAVSTENPTENPAAKAKPDPPTDVPMGAPDMHLELSARINELERERTSRWSRILQMLTSGGGS